MLWALLLCGGATAVWLLRWRRSGQGCYDRLALDAMYLFARLWHRYAPGPAAPLPAAGPVILIANHPSHADPAFLMASSNRPLRFLQAAECYNVFLLRQWFRWTGCIPVRRRGRDLNAIHVTLDQLKRGEVVAIFPEGDVGTGGPDRLGPGKSGAALFALRSGAAVIPAWIAGGPTSPHLIAAWLLPSAGVRVRFGRPIDLTGYRNRPIAPKLLREVTALFMQRVEQLRSRA